LPACLAVTLLCYLPTLTLGWTHWDDDAYIYSNALTKDLSMASLPRFFGTWQVGNYHPFAMLSLALDYRLFGMNAAGFHAHAVILHLVNVALVFWFVRLLGGGPWASAVTAALFGIHPCHVESVAWISERKDLLYVMYYLGGLIAYLKYVQSRRGARFYVLTLALFVASCLSKGQAVTFPIALLLVDYYLQRPFTRIVWLEKAPLLVVALACGGVAIRAQQSARAVLDLASYSIGQRLAFAAYALSHYLRTAVLPLHLSAFYPYPRLENGHFGWAPCASMVAAILVIGAVVVATKPRRPLAFGVAFFLVTIAVVLQVLPVGSALMADRYTYLSFVGLFFPVGIGVQRLVENTSATGSALKPYALAFAIAIGVALCTATSSRIRIWSTDETLFLDMLHHDPEIAVANNNLANHYHQTGRKDLALKFYNEAIRLQPNAPDTYRNRGHLFYAQGRYEWAIADYDSALKRGDADPNTRNNYAYYLALKGGDLERARTLIREALDAKPEAGEYMDTYAVICYRQKRYDEAKAWLEKALRSGQEGNGVVLEHYGDVLFQTGDTTGAVNYWQRARERHVRSETIEEKIRDRRMK
jgi:Tfp pilus assembly protein PilF